MGSSLARGCAGWASSNPDLVHMGVGVLSPALVGVRMFVLDVLVLM